MKITYLGMVGFLVIIAVSIEIIYVSYVEWPRIGQVETDRQGRPLYKKNQLIIQYEDDISKPSVANELISEDTILNFDNPAISVIQETFKEAGIDYTPEILDAIKSDYYYVVSLSDYDDPKVISSIVEDLPGVRLAQPNFLFYSDF